MKPSLGRKFGQLAIFSPELILLARRDEAISGEKIASWPKEEGGQRWFHLYPGQQLKPSDPLHWTFSAENQ